MMGDAAASAQQVGNKKSINLGMITMYPYIILRNIYSFTMIIIAGIARFALPAVSEHIVVSLHASATDCKS